MKIFISYRRADSRKDAGRIYDRLIAVFGKDSIFRDLDDIPAGVDFRKTIQDAVHQCNVQLAVIGKLWLENEQGKRRLDDPEDFVRIEIETALQRDSCRVIPVLVDGASMPLADNLPPSLRDLTFKQAINVRDDPDFHRDVDKIIRELGGQPAPATTPPLPAPQTSNYDVHAAITAYYKAFDTKDLVSARRILTAIRNSDEAPLLFDIDSHEQELQAIIEAEEHDVERGREYALLRLMFERPNPNPTRVWEALKVFWQTYPDYDPDGIAKKVRPLRILELIPTPFEWLNIPGGIVTLDKGWNNKAHNVHQTFTIPPFQMAKYPLTNAQYARFIEAGGYQQKQWWTEDGWEIKEQEMWKEPRYWSNQTWNGGKYPIVGVSWYETVAFCLWLSDVLEEDIMLPTEQQWQHAAQGNDGRAYSWGNEWEVSHCNNNVRGTGIGQTTPVTLYQDRGDSPFGVVDMTGNVWEWCLTGYETGSQSIQGTDIRALRGGSWDYDDPGLFRVTVRGSDPPHSRDASRGFRIARSLE